jgi:hypothetical protein
MDPGSRRSSPPSVPGKRNGSLYGLDIKRLPPDQVTGSQPGGWPAEGDCRRALHAAAAKQNAKR